MFHMHLHVGERNVDLNVADGEVAGLPVHGTLEPVFVDLRNEGDDVILLKILKHILRHRFLVVFVRDSRNRVSCTRK